METNHNNTTMTTNTSEFHRLKNKWNLWAHLPQDPDWSVNSYEKIYQFQTVEEVVGITESLPPDLVKKCMLFIMKDGINPMWEDKNNRDGGCFSYKVLNDDVFNVWKKLTYILVGNSISTNSTFVNSVNGITVSPKKKFCIVKIWLSNCKQQDPKLVTDETTLSPVGCLFKKHTPEF